MKPKRKVEEAIRRKLRFTAGSTFRDRLFSEVMNAHEEFQETRPVLHEPGIRRRIMRSPIARFASIAAVIGIAVVTVGLWSRFTAPAYALDQTVDALKSVRALHIVSKDEAGRTTDERWIEVGENGSQTRYRQQHPRSLLLKYEQTGQVTLAPGDDLTMVPMAVEDGQSTALYRHDKRAVILYDRNDQQFQWVGDLGGTFENLRNEGKILEENVDYHGRRAHKVWWPALSSECYVDPETKLPMAIGNTEISYEEPPAGTFEIVIPDGFAVLDKRPGAPVADVPDWLQNEDDSMKSKQESFRKGARALARGDYAEAAEQLKRGIQVDSWAPFWLGSAYYGLGQYDLAIESYNRHLELHRKAGGGEALPYCHYARGLAYARLGMLDEARKDFQLCLPAMIRTLRTPSGGDMFEYADTPLIRFGQYHPGEWEFVTKMINRLRLISGQNFGYDPAGTKEQNEAAITAWEQWFKTDGQIRFTPDAVMLPVPVSPDSDPPDAESSPIAAWMKTLGYGRKSNHEIAARYSSEWLDELQKPGSLLRTGMALYDVGRYRDALALFEQMEKKASEDQLKQAIALLWQGQMLDLLGTRDLAVSAYQKVVNMDISRETHIRHDQFGLAFSPSQYAGERMSTPFVRVENLWDD